MTYSHFITMEGDTFFFDAYPAFGSVLFQIKKGDSDPIGCILSHNQAYAVAKNLMIATQRKK